MATVQSTKGIFGQEQTHQEMTTSSLDLFGMPTFESIMRHGEDILINPQNSLSSSPYTFQIRTTDPTQFTYLPQSSMHGTVRISRADGTPIQEEDNVSIANCLPLALFNQCECYVNQTLVSDLSSNSYAYKSYNELMHSYSSQVKNKNLETLMYSYESPDEVHTQNTVGDANVNSALRARKLKYLVGSKEVHFARPLFADFCMTEKFLPPETTLDLRFHRQSDSFCIIARDERDYKIEILDLYLVTRRVTVSDVFARSFANARLKEALRFPFVLCGIRHYLLTRGTQTKIVPSISAGIKNLRQILVTFHDNSAFNGLKAANPFVSSPNDIQEIHLIKDGKPYYNLHRPLSFNKDKNVNGFVHGYLHHLRNLGIGYTDNEAMSLAEYSTNLFGYSIDFSPELCNNWHSHKEQNSSIDLSLTFAKPLPETIIVCVYLSRDVMLQIQPDGRSEVIEC